MDRIGPITSEIIDLCVKEVNTEKNKTKVYETVIDPLIDHIIARIYPYIIATSCTFMVIILLSIVIIYLIITNKSI